MKYNFLDLHLIIFEVNFNNKKIFLNQKTSSILALKNSANEYIKALYSSFSDLATLKYHREAGKIQAPMRAIKRNAHFIPMA